MSETVSVRLPAEAMEGLASLAEATGVARSDLLREVVQRGIAAKRLDVAIEAYRTRRSSLGRAAEIAQLPIAAFLDEVRRQGIVLSYDLREFQHDAGKGA